MPPATEDGEPAGRMRAFSTRCASPILVAEFATPQTMLSWSLTRPGFVTARAVAWLEVGDRDLPVDVDPAALLGRRMAEVGLREAVHLMTSRTVTRHHLAGAVSGDVTASCLATVGLSNAGRVGHVVESRSPVGTINLLAHVSRPLSEAATIEALSIAAEARTAAVMDLGLLRGGHVVTGTGTDCIVVASPCTGPATPFAGLHTDVGIALGHAVYDAVREGGEAWLAERRALAMSGPSQAP